MPRLSGKVAIVTGGASGIGAAFAEALAGEGAAVAIADTADGHEIAARLEAKGARAHFIATDVASESSVHDLAKAAETAFGGVDILVNNAALFSSLTKKSFFEIDVQEWDRVMAVNVRGPFLCAKFLAPLMKRRGGGKIVNIASGTVFKGNAGMLHYVSSKGAVVAMTRSLARELGSDNICVNAIAPGLTLSDGVKANPTWHGAAAEATIASRALRRPQEPRDLVGTLLFLASAESDFMTGQTIVVDGGAVMR